MQKMSKDKHSRQTGFIYPLKSDKYERSAVPSEGVDLIAIQDKIKKELFWTLKPNQSNPWFLSVIKACGERV